MYMLCMYVCVVCMYVYIFTYKYIYQVTYVHFYAWIYIHIYRCICIWSRLPSLPVFYPFEDERREEPQDQGMASREFETHASDLDKQFRV